MVRNGLLNLDDVPEMVRFLWSQGGTYPDLGTIAFANERGEFIGANRPEDYVVLALADQTGGAIRKLEPGPQGEITSSVISESPGYDARGRDWYRTARAAGKPTWTEISLSVTTARLDLSAVTPYYDDSGVFRGVFLVDVALEQINRLLARQVTERGGAVFVVDRSGFLVGASTEPVVRRDGAGSGVERALAVASPDPVIAQAAQYLQEQWRGFADIRDFVRGDFELEGRRHFLSAAAYRNNGSLNWVIVSTIPELAVMGPLQDSARSSLALGTLAFLLSILGAVWIANWVARPLSRLGQAAQAMGRGEWTAPLALERTDEVGELAQAFNLMAERLQASMNRLSGEVSLRKRRAEELAVSERRNRALLDAIPDLMFVNSEEGRFLDCRARDPRELYLPAEKIVGRTVGEVLPPASAAAFTDLIRRTLASGSAQTLEYSLRIGDQEEWFEARTVPYLPGQALTLCRNITKRVQAEAEREQLEMRLAQAQRMEAVGTLAGGVAHEFNNLLQIISGNIDLMRGSAGGGEPVRRSLDIMDHMIDRATDLVRGLLTFARRHEPTRRIIDLREVVELARGMLLPTLPRMIAVETRLAPELWSIRADPNEMEQILLNLATNARDAMPDGGTLTIAAENLNPADLPVGKHQWLPGASYVHLRVSDTGHGLDAQTASRIFEPFYTTKPVGQGTGLGLAVVYGIVKEHDGQIDVDSAPGSGTAFHLYFPAVRETAVATAKIPRGEPAGVPSGTETVLVVDDEAEIRVLLMEGLSQQGYRVLAATTGEECLEILADRGDEVGAVVLDLGMPGMGGRACLREFRKTHPKLPVIVATGILHEEETVEVTDRIQKPYALALLLEKLKKIFATEGSAPKPPDRA
ncbi:MAG: HAMP domain-containing protein [Proteobacteria bacterium]|nr:HAMP domain-containing protein [Pseudomonadota bacterium]